MGKGGKNIYKKWGKGLSPPPDIMTFSSFLTILTHYYIIKIAQKYEQKVKIKLNFNLLTQ